jgi:hypothetical protein
VFAGETGVLVGDTGVFVADGTGVFVGSGSESLQARAMTAIMAAAAIGHRILKIRFMV